MSHDTIPSSMPITATISVPDEQEHLGVLFSAELTRTHERSTITLQHERGKAVFTITAQDPTALRAATTAITSILGTHAHTRAAIHHEP
jgi:tRNA threonylcarbamoyladenosine modification (KEOPS) complex  Pcc1 subunit